MAREIMLEIDFKNLDMKMEALDFRGEGCKTAVDDLQEVLGMSTRSERIKPEIKEVINVQHARRGR